MRTSAGPHQTIIQQPAAMNDYDELLLEASEGYLDELESNSLRETPSRYVETRPDTHSVEERTTTYGFAAMPRGRAGDTRVRNSYDSINRRNVDYWDETTNSPRLEKFEWQGIVVQIPVVPPKEVPIEKKQVILQETVSGIENAERRGSWTVKFDAPQSRHGGNMSPSGDADWRVSCAVAHSTYGR